MECKVCHEPFYYGRAIKGICASCYSTRSSSQGNDTRIGVASKAPTFSFEFEATTGGAVDGREDHDPIDLTRYGFMPCDESTADVEYKSPIYNDMRSLNAVLPVLENCAWAVTDTCGTHIHVGYAGSKSTVKRHLHEIVPPLERYILDDPEATKRFWGRGFGEHRHEMVAFPGTYPTRYVAHELRLLRNYRQDTELYTGQVACVTNNRYTWINLNTDFDTIEWRLPRFRDAAQFKRVVQFVRAATSLINRCRSTHNWAIGDQLLALYKQHESGLLQLELTVEGA